MINLNELSRLESDDLLKHLNELCCTSRATVARVVAVLAEIECRKIHVDLGFSSMLELCEDRFGMSKGEACRRLVAARLVGICPSIPARLERGEISLYALGLLRNHLTE